MIQEIKREDIKLADWEYQYQQRGEQPILLCDYFCRSLPQYLISNLSNQEESCGYLFTDSSKGYNAPRDKERIDLLLADMITDRERLEYLLKGSIEIPKNFNTLAEAVNTALANGSLSNKQLAQFWKAMDDDFLRVLPWFYYPWYLSKDDLLTNKVKEGLEHCRAKIEEVCDFDEALLALIFPTKKTAFQLEQDDMLGLVHIAKKNPDFSRDPAFKAAASTYLEKYDWLTTFILTPLLPMTYEQLVGRVTTALNESFESTLILQKEASRRKEELADRLMKIFTNDAELLQSIADARELGFVLTAGIEEAYKSSARYLKFMQIVAGRIGIMFEDLKYLLSQEIQNALNTDQKISPKILEERREGFIMMTQQGNQSVLFGEEGHQLSQWIDTELNKVDSSIIELKGTIACRGLATGRVKITTSPNEAGQLIVGEILVCPMTNPDYVPAMRRSAAIVTDEGGLLSHAAIMSREFGKPCVIGTRIATQVLHDGDLVEVDAEKGTVTVLKKYDLV